MSRFKGSFVTDDDNEIIFVAHVPRQDFKSEESKADSTTSLNLTDCGKLRVKAGPKQRRLQKANFPQNANVVVDTDDSLHHDDAPIAVISKIFSLAPNELHWAPELKSSSVRDSIALNSNRVMDRKCGTKTEEGNAVKMKLSSEGENSSRKLTEQRSKEEIIDRKRRKPQSLPARYCGTRAIESLKQQISISQQVNHMDHAFHQCTCEEIKVAQLPANSKIECVNLSSSDEEGYNSESTEPNEDGTSGLSNCSRGQPPQCTTLIRSKIECMDISSSSDEEVEEESSNPKKLSSSADKTRQMDENAANVHSEQNVANGVGIAKPLDTIISAQQPAANDEVSAFINYCKDTMKNRGLNYNDFINYSDNQGYIYSENQVSLFMNNRLCCKATRKLMSLMKQFLQEEYVHHCKLEEDTVNCIDRGRIKMLARDLYNTDFLTWARVRQGLILKGSVVGYFMNKKLNERRTREILPLFRKFVDDETFDPKPKWRQRNNKLKAKQKSVLKEAFEEHPHPSKSQIRRLANRLHVSRSTIWSWFLKRNRRHKED